MTSHIGGHDRRAETLPAAAVVVCTRDRSDMLSNALARLAESVTDDVEIVVVDSGSRTDATRLVAEAARVRYVRSDVPGLSIARNIGLRSTQREVVVFTDDDAVVEPGFLAPLRAAFACSRVAAAAGRLRDADGSTGGHLSDPETLRAVTDGLDVGHGALMAFRRETILAAGGFDPLLGAGRRWGGAEDMDAFCRLLFLGHEIARVPAAVVTHVNTRDDRDYIALNENYGRGIGAMCAKWMRVSRREGVRLAAVVVRRGIVRYVRRFGARRSRRGQQAYLRSVLRGYREGRRVPVERMVFRDDRPPTRIPPAAAGDPPRKETLTS